MENRYDGCSSLNQYLNTFIELFKDKCLLKLSGLGDLTTTEETSFKEITEKVKELNESKIEKCRLVFAKNNSLKQSIFINTSQEEKIEIYCLNAARNEHKIEVNKSDLNNQQESLLYSVVVRNGGLIYFKPDFIDSLSELFSKLMNGLNKNNEPNLEASLMKYLEAFKILFECFRQVDCKILKSLKSNLKSALTKTSLSTILSGLNEIDEILNEKIQLLIDLVGLECQRLLRESVSKHRA